MTRVGRVEDLLEGQAGSILDFQLLVFLDKNILFFDSAERLSLFSLVDRWATLIAANRCTITEDSPRCKLLAR